MLEKNGALCFSITTWAPPGQKTLFYSLRNPSTWKTVRDIGDPQQMFTE